MSAQRRLAVLLSLFLTGAAPAQEAAVPQAGDTAVAAGPHTPDSPPWNKVRLDFRDVPVLQVIRVISEITGANIVATEKAGQSRVTVFLQNVGMKEALDAISKAAGLWYRVDSSGVYRMMTAEEYQRDIVVFRAEETRVMTLRNANVVAAANAVVALFGSRVVLSEPTEEAPLINVPGFATGSSSGGSGATGGGGATASGTGAAPAGQGDTLTSGQIGQMLERQAQRSDGSGAEQRLADTAVQPPAIHITYNRLHNLLIMRSADLDALTEAQRLVEQIDRPTRQVLLEMKILEVTLGDSLRSVFDIGLTGGPLFTGPDTGFPPNPLDTQATEGSRITLGAGNFPLEGGTLVFQLMNDRVLARLQMLATQNKVKVLSTPMLLASNNQAARLFIGEERILTTGITSDTVTNESQTITTFTAQTERRDIGNTLTILPRINADRTVSLAISQDTSSVLPKSATIPVGSAGNIQEFPVDTVNTANLQVSVVAKDRLAVAVGGMIRERAADAETKVPLLGDVPGVGNLFKRRVKENAKTEMVLLITPYIMDTPEEAEQRSRERLGSVMEQTGTLDTAQAPTSAMPPPQPAEDPYLALAQKAARLLDGGGAPETVGLEAVPTPVSGSAWLDAAGRLSARPLGAWRSEGRYVTAVELANLDTAPATLDTKAFAGDWLAAAVELDRLAPAGEPGSRTRAFLLSERPFDESLQGLASGGVRP